MKNKNNKIFIVEDNPMYQKMIKYVVEMNPDHEVHTFTTGRECVQNLHLKPGIISLDYSLPDGSGYDFLKEIKKYDPSIGVIILSGQQDVNTAVSLLKEGAFDYITKDSETKGRLLKSLAQLKKQLHLEVEVQSLKEELKSKYSFSDNLIGNSPAMLTIHQLIEKSLNNDITVSISGETGTGKEVVAKCIHYHSKRSKGPFIAVNMGAIPKDLLESELFGHEKGAFTGALSRKKGLFEQSHKGTLFLDEIAELELNLQAKVLRALQEREILRVGGQEMVKFDARIIIATHKDLAEEVENHNFREDLYFRVLGLPIHLPPLRERGNDVILLAEHFLHAFLKTNKMEKKQFSSTAKKALLAYSFPGNVRELKAIVELAAVLSTGELIEAANIQFKKLNRKDHFLQEEMTLEAYKLRIIAHFLDKYNRDVNKVAQQLDIGKSTIYRLLKEQEV